MLASISTHKPAIILNTILLGCRRSTQCTKMSTTQEEEEEIEEREKNSRSMLLNHDFKKTTKRSTKTFILNKIINFFGLHCLSTAIILIISQSLFIQ